MNIDQTKKQKRLLYLEDSNVCPKMGLKVTKLHIVYQFRMLPWLAKKNRKNSDARANAKTIFGKFFF